MSGIIFCLQRGYRWADVPSEYGPAKTLYNRYKRWSGAGVFERIFNALAHKDADFQTLMLDEPHVKTHRIALKLSLLPRILPKLVIWYL